MPDTVQTKHIILICYIGDPFDPPGYERFGGGHLFLFDLGRFLIQRGYQITYVTRLNDENKKTEVQLGERCRIIREQVGPAQEIPPGDVAKYLEPLAANLSSLISNLPGNPRAIHSHYWIAGECARRVTNEHSIPHVHSILSLGRLKSEQGEKRSQASTLRDQCEVQIFDSANVLVAACPNEEHDLRRLYPEVTGKNLKVLPYGVDPNVFYPRPESQLDSVRRAADRLAKRSSTFL